MPTLRNSTLHDAAIWAWHVFFAVPAMNSFTRGSGNPSCTLDLALDYELSEEYFSVACNPTTVADKAARVTARNGLLRVLHVMKSTKSATSYLNTVGITLLENETLSDDVLAAYALLLHTTELFTSLPILTVYQEVGGAQKKVKVDSDSAIELPFSPEGNVHSFIVKEATVHVIGRITEDLPFRK